MTSQLRAIRHRFAKAVVCWFVKHSGTGAFAEMESAETKAMVAGLRRDLEATNVLARALVETNKRSLVLIARVLQKHAAWEAADKRLMAVSRKLLTQQRRAQRPDGPDISPDASTDVSTGNSPDIAPAVESTAAVV